MSEKIENLLTVSMDISEEERKKSEQLSAGFNSEDQSWEFVMKYSGSEEPLKDVWPRPIVFLYNQYAVSRGTKEEIERLSENPQVEWIEKPKLMEYSVLDGIRASCISPLIPSAGILTGKGVLIAIIDSGIDIFHPDFRKEDGTTRIMGLWDQTGGNQREGEAPEGYFGGTYYNEERINHAIQISQEKGITAGREAVKSRDLSGHGTHVAGIAAGNGSC